MVAYSFKQQFAPPILAGTKRHTVRNDRKRHARPGEELQLYTGMRTRQCKLLARSICEDVVPITFWFDDDPESEGIVTPGFGYPGGLEGFAVADGFASWAELKKFWRVNHPNIWQPDGSAEFKGVLIIWGDLIDIDRIKEAV